VLGAETVANSEQGELVGGARGGEPAQEGAQRRGAGPSGEQGGGLFGWTGGEAGGKADRREDGVGDHEVGVLLGEPLWRSTEGSSIKPRSRVPGQFGWSWRVRSGRRLSLSTGVSEQGEPLSADTLILPPEVIVLRERSVMTIFCSGWWRCSGKPIRSQPRRREAYRQA
jgi:hypothetical protein